MRPDGPGVLCSGERAFGTWQHTWLPARLRLDSIAPGRCLPARIASGRTHPGRLWQLRYPAALPGKLHQDRGCLQVSLPIATVDGCPLGLGLMGPRGSDEDLLQLAGDILALLKQPSADVGGAAAER